MNLIKSMKKLGKKMTGSDVRGDDLAEIVENIAEGYSGGGGDNIEQVTFTRVDGTTVRSDKTAGEIINSYLSGKVVIGSITGEMPVAGGMVAVFKYAAFLNTVMYSQETNMGFIAFLNAQPQDNNCALALISATINGDLDINLFEIRAITFNGESD